MLCWYTQRWVAGKPVPLGARVVAGAGLLVALRHLLVSKAPRVHPHFTDVWKAPRALVSRPTMIEPSQQGTGVARAHASIWWFS